MLKRGLSLILAIILVVLSCPAAFAEKATENVKPSRRSVEEILAEGRAKMVEVEKEESNACMVQSESSTSEVNSKKRSIKTATINELKNEGYEAYDVNPSSYDAVQTELKTNLEDIGLTPDGSYIIVVSGEEGQGGDSINVQVPIVDGDIDPSFEFTYNGVTHTMRYLTVEAYEHREYTKASIVDLLNSNKPNIIENCFNAALNAALSNTSVAGMAFGTICSICGVKLINISTTQQTTLVLHAGTSWSRVHTQIYDAGYEQWFSWSTVDSACGVTNLSGMYYSIPLKRYTSIPEDEVIRYSYSEHYYDYQWRKSRAARGWSLGTRYREYAGDVSYYHDGRCVITHCEYTD